MESCKNCGHRGEPDVDVIQTISFCANCGATLDDDQQLVGGWAGSWVGGTGVRIHAGDDGRSAGCYGNLRVQSQYSNELAKARNLKELTRQVREVGSNLQLSGTLQMEAVDMALQLAPDWFSTRRMPGALLAAACVFIGGRINQLPITLISAANASQQRVQVLGRAICQLARAMEISVPNTPVASFIAATIASLPQLSAIQPAVQGTAEALFLWMDEQNLPGSCVPKAAACIALAAEAVQVEVTLPELSVKVHYGIHSLRGSAASLRNALIDACHTLLPWAGAVTPTTVAQYTGIILKLHEFRQPAAVGAAAAGALPDPQIPPPELPGVPPHRAAVSGTGGQVQAAGSQGIATDLECGPDTGVDAVMGADGSAPPAGDEIRSEVGLAEEKHQPPACSSESVDNNPPSTTGLGERKRGLPGQESDPPQMLAAQELLTCKRVLRRRP